MAHTCFSVDDGANSGGVAQLRMNRPERANSMIPEFWRELPLIVSDLANSGTARVIVYSGEGRHWCSGMDVSVFGAAANEAGGNGPGAAPRRAANFRETVLLLQQTVNSLEKSRVPVIAAIQGACMGGGLDLATACDMRYATEDAFFCVQEINIGMVADVGTLQRLPKLIPEGVARELAYTGRRMSAVEAKACGLVNEVFADVSAMNDAVDAVAREIASKSPLAVSGTKQTMLYARDHSVSDALDYIATWQAGMFDPSDMTEAFTAQMEKRPPNYANLAPLRNNFTD